MGQVNQPSTLLDQIKELRRELAEVRKSIGLSSAHINSGGLTLSNNAFLRMVDDDGIEILYAGPDSQGRQVVSLRREGGPPLLYTFFAAPGRQYWALTDRTGNQLLADDAISGVGLARPSLLMPTRPVAFDSLPSTGQTAWTDVVDTGWAYKQQARLYVQLAHCTTLADTTGEVRVTLDGVQVGSIIQSSWSVAYVSIGPFAVDGAHMSQHRLALQCRRTGGTGRVGASMTVRGEPS